MGWDGIGIGMGWDGICCESRITREADFNSSICTQDSAATSVGTYWEVRCDEMAWSSVCISKRASWLCCSSARSVASARDAASRISSSGWERDERTAFSTCECMLTWRSQWGYSGVGDGREDGVQHLTARRAATRQ